ncbi:MAG TPA: hypothetical protein VKP14_10225 [Gaiellaceae bacterium]|nr:hypothetical protein [Gaiellaceae bacterium]
MIVDEFEEGALANRWTSLGSVAVGDDGGNVDAWGIVHLDTVAGATAAIALARRVPLGARVWRLSCLVRSPTRSVDALTTLAIGVGPPGALTADPDGASFTITNGQANWQWRRSSGGVTTGDSGVACTLAPGAAADCAYQHLELRCDGATLSWLIDGVVVQTAAVPPDVLNGWQVKLRLFVDGADGGNTSWNFDSVKLWVQR